MARLTMALTHDLHRRNWLASGAVGVLQRAGHELHAIDLRARHYKALRRVLRLGSLVAQARTGRRTYIHKLSLPRPFRDRVAIACWNRVTDPERAARHVEARLPIPADAWKILNDTNPTLVLIPTMIHEDAADDLAKAAQRVGIPVVAAWASWDTGSSKGGHLIRPDALLVWGAASARHAERDHGFAQQAVAVTGPPHWDHYSEPRAARPRTKILIAGTSVSYWRDEEDIAGRLTEDFPTRVIYRRHPRRGGEWSWKACLELRDQLDETAVVVAAFSTVIVEAALQGIPSCIVAFGRGAAGNGLAPLAEYQHMAEVLGWRGVVPVSGYDELVSEIMNVLDNAERWPRLMESAREVADADGHCRERIAEALAYYLKEGTML